MDIGDKLPEILGYDAEGNLVTLKDFEGQMIILYFYSKDNTPGCTAEACSLRDHWKELTAEGYTVIGVSKDSATSHRKFSDKHSLPFILISDVEHRLAEECGVWQLKKMAGREYFGMVRTTFITDTNHIVTDVIRKVNTKDAAGQIFDLLKGREDINPGPEA